MITLERANASESVITFHKFCDYTPATHESKITSTLHACDYGCVAMRDSRTRNSSIPDHKLKHKATNAAFRYDIGRHFRAFDIASEHDVRCTMIVDYLVAQLSSMHFYLVALESIRALITSTEK